MRRSYQCYGQGRLQTNGTYCGFEVAIINREPEPISRHLAQVETRLHRQIPRLASRELQVGCIGPDGFDQERTAIIDRISQFGGLCVMRLKSMLCARWIAARQQVLRIGVARLVVFTVHCST